MYFYRASISHPWSLQTNSPRSASLLPRSGIDVLRSIVLLCYCWPVCVSPAVTWEEILAQPEPASADARIRYGNDSIPQYGDLRLPGGAGPFPVAVVIHGGCWRANTSQTYIAGLSAALTAIGVATWTLEFRRLGNSGGGWPGTFEDVAAGTDLLRELGGGFPLDMDRVIAIGHSSGGHLALWLGMRAGLNAADELFVSNPLPLTGIVALAGISDLRAYGSGRGACNRAVNVLMGGSRRQQPDRYRQANPVEMLPMGLQVILIHGSSDTIVPPRQSRIYARQARKGMDAVELLILKRAGHFDLVAPFAQHWQAVEREIGKLLQIGESPGDNKKQPE